MGIGLLAAAIALIVALGFYRLVGAWVVDWVDSRNAANLIGFALVFVVVIIAGAIMSALVARLLRGVGLGWLDRMAGGGLGLVKGVLLGVVVVLAMTAFSGVHAPEAVRTSVLSPYVIRASNAVAYFAPRELKDGFHRTYEKLRQSWNEMQREWRSLPDRV
jgi:membrane protein required for colicin V production